MRYLLRSALLLAAAGACYGGGDVNSDALGPIVPTLTFVGRVTSAASGIPIAGAEVSVTRPGGGPIGPEVVGMTAGTGEDGTYQLVWDRGGMCSEIRIYAEATGYSRSALLDVACTPEPQTVNFALRGGP